MACTGFASVKRPMAATRLRLLWMSLSLSYLAVSAHAQIDTMQGIVELYKSTQHTFLERWSFHPQMACDSARVYGPMQKQAQGSELYVLFDRFTRVSKFFDNTHIPIFDSLQVHVSHKYKFVYVRQPKSSSSSIITTLSAMYCAEPRTCLPEELERVPVRSIGDKNWTDYFVFTAVRNPISRMMSTYLMFEDILRMKTPGSQVPGEPCHIPFSRFSTDVILLRNICYLENCCTYIARSYNKFLENFPAAHLSQQSHTVFMPDGRSFVDYIARTEEIGEDWVEVVAKIEERSGIPVKMVQIHRTNAHHLSDADIAGGDAIKCFHPDVLARNLLNATTLFQIAQQFSTDMVQLGFLPLPKELPSPSPLRV